MGGSWVIAQGISVEGKRPWEFARSISILESKNAARVRAARILVFLVIMRGGAAGVPDGLDGATRVW